MNRGTGIDGMIVSPNLMCLKISTKTMHFARRRWLIEGALAMPDMARILITVIEP